MPVKPGRLIVRVILLLAVLWPAAAPGQTPEEPYSVDFSAGWGGCYRPLRWTPVELSIATRFTEPVAAAITVSGQQDQLTRLTVAHPAVLTPGLPLYLPLVTKLSFAADGLTVRIAPQSGKGWEKRYDLWDFSRRPKAITAVRPIDVLIGVAGGVRGGLELLERHAGPAGGNGRGGRVYVRDKPIRQLPWDWTGYDSLDTLVLNDIDFLATNAQQGKAIAQWVTNGGRLMIVPGGRPLPADHPIARLLPFALDRPEQAGAGGATVTRWLNRSRLEASLPPAWEVKGDDELFMAGGLVGFGRVAVLSANPAQLRPAGGAALIRLWLDQINGLRKGDGELVYLESERDDNTDWNYRFDFGEEGNAVDAVLDHLYQVPELRPLGVGWVVVLLLSLAALIGPIDYFVLKRLDRLPWTWVTCGSVIVLFTVGAYFGVRALRAGSTTVRSVSVIDAVLPGAGGGDGSAGPVAWSTCYTAIFADDSGDYKLTNLSPGQWWSSVCPSEGESHFSFGQEVVSRQIQAEQQDGSNLPVSVPIGIWSIQGLVSEQPVAADRLPVTARVRLDGDELVVTVTNHSPTPADYGVAAVADGTVRIGPVAGKSTAEFRAVPSRIAPADPELAVREFGGVSGQFLWRAPGVADRTAALSAWLARGSAVVTVQFHSNQAPHAVVGPCRQEHWQRVRLVVPVEKGTSR